MVPTETLEQVLATLREQAEDVQNNLYDLGVNEGDDVIEKYPTLVSAIEYLNGALGDAQDAVVKVLAELSDAEYEVEEEGEDD